MLPIKTLYDNYPEADLLPIEVTEDTTLQDVEESNVCDTLFLFLCRELCNPADNESNDWQVLLARCDRAIADLVQVRCGLQELASESDTGRVAAD